MSDKPIPFFDLTKVSGRQLDRCFNFDDDVLNHKPLHIFLICSLLTVCILIIKCKEQFSNPQFWAEDCLVFFSFAHALGWGAIIKPYAGYLHFLPVTGANIAVNFPLLYAPLIMLTLDVAFRAVAVGYLASQIRDLKILLPVMIAILFCSQTNEAIGNLNSVQWYCSYALLGALITLRAPKNSLVSVCTLAFLFFCAASTPLSITLIPLFALRIFIGSSSHFQHWHITKNLYGVSGRLTWPNIVSAVLIVAGLIQAYAMATSDLPVNFQAYDMGATEIVTRSFVRVAGPWATYDVASWKIWMSVVGTLVGLVFLFVFSGKYEQYVLFYLYTFLIVVFITMLAKFIQQPKPLAVDIGGDRYFWIQRSLLMGILLFSCIKLADRYLSPWSRTALLAKVLLLASTTMLLQYHSRFSFIKAPLINYDWPAQALSAKEKLLAGENASVKVPPGWKCVIRQPHHVHL
jgi:hypothetical protein